MREILSKNAVIEDLQELIDTLKKTSFDELSAYNMAQRINSALEHTPGKGGDTKLALQVLS